MRKVWFAVIGGAVFMAIGGAAQACHTAHEDIARLKHEKTSTAERVVKGVTSIMPLGFVMHTVTGTEKHDVEIATGDYNKQIDMRIAEIKDTCGVE